jgi:hypothetical protein
MSKSFLWPFTVGWQPQDKRIAAGTLIGSFIGKK